MKIILMPVLLVMIFMTSQLKADFTCRGREQYSTYVPTHTLYYYSGGSYYYYQGGDHGPLYYWQYGKYHLYEKETIVLVPKAIKVEVQRDHYYSINAAARDDLLADAIVGRLLRLQNEKPSRGSTRTTPSTKSEEPEESVESSGSYQDAALVAVINASCAKCHGPTSKYTKFITADGKLPDLPAGKLWEAFGLVTTGEMPKGGTSLDNDKLALFHKWAKSAKKGK